MPIQTDSLNRKLYELLNSRGYDPVPRDSDVANAGKTVPPEEADVFKFTFKQAGKPVDDAWVSVDGAENLTLYYDQDLASKAGNRTPGTQFDDSWYGLLRHLKKWAHARQLSFKLEPKEKIDSDMAQRTYMKKKEQIAEGYYPMGKSASYNDNVPTVKIILQHTRQIQEGEQRYRNIAKIFLENTQGERILAPTNKPGLAQVYARHIAEGGVPNDDRWNHIKGLCEEYSKMAGFVRAVRGNQFNESAQKVVEAGLNHYQSLRESLSKMRGHRGYSAYFESYTPALMEDDTDSDALNELFVQETMDPRIESVMPILSKLTKNLGEMKEVNELAEWADSLTEAPGAETLAHNERTAKSNLNAFDLEESEVEEGLGDIVKKVGSVAKKVGGKVIDKLGHGSDEDLIKDLQKKVGMPQTGKKPQATYNGEVEEGVLDTVKKVGGKILDKLGHGSDEDLIRDLQKKAGVPQTGKKPEAPKKPVEEGDGGQEALNPIGIPEGLLHDAGQEDSPVASAIVRRILMQRHDLLAKYGPEAVGQAVDSVADFVGDVDEIGSSDVSGWVKQVERELGGISEMDSQGYKGTRDSDDELGGPETTLGSDSIAKPKDVASKALGILNKEFAKAQKADEQGVDEGIADDYEDMSDRELMRHAGMLGLEKNCVPDEEGGLANRREIIYLLQKEAESDLDEGLDANQKRVGQLGPTEKVRNNNIGKLVGANESVEFDELADLRRLLGK